MGHQQLSHSTYRGCWWSSPAQGSVTGCWLLFPGGAGFPSSGSTHRGLCHPLAFPKPCQASGDGWAAGFQGLEVLGRVSRVLFTPDLLCRMGGCPTGGCLCAEAAGFTPGVTLGSGHGRTHGTFCPSFLVHCWDKQWWLQARLHPAPSGCCWEDVAFMEEQEEAAPVSLGSRLSVSCQRGTSGHQFFQWARGG